MSIEKEKQSGFVERLPMLRKERGLNQREFAYDFAKFLGRDKSYSFTTISAWELGRKTPPLQILYKLADYFDVSVDYMCGLSSEKKGISDRTPIDEKSKEERDLIIQENKILIDKDDWKKYDTLPVYVVFDKLQSKNTWGILNLKEQRILTLKGFISIGQYDIKLYAYPLPSEIFYNFWKIHSYSLQQLLQANLFWIEIYSTDIELKEKYRGWYKHTPDRSAIINCSNGLLLPYSGLNVSYCAYNNPRANG